MHAGEYYVICQNCRQSLFGLDLFDIGMNSTNVIFLFKDLCGCFLTYITLNLLKYISANYVDQVIISNWPFVLSYMLKTED